MNKAKIVAKILLALIVLSSIGGGGYLIYQFSRQHPNLYYEDDETTKHNFEQPKFTARETQQLLRVENQNYYFDLVNFQYLFLMKLKTSYRELLAKTITFSTENQKQPKVIRAKIHLNDQNELNWKYSII